MATELHRYEIEGTGQLVRILVSGVPGEFWPLSADESKLMADYRLIKNHGRGTLLIEFIDFAITKYETRFGGDVKLMNTLLGKPRLLRE